jgi:hypothetical protein
MKFILSFAALASIATFVLATSISGTNSLAAEPNDVLPVGDMTSTGALNEADLKKELDQLLNELVSALNASALWDEAPQVHEANDAEIEQVELEEDFKKFEELLRRILEQAVEQWSLESEKDKVMETFDADAEFKKVEKIMNDPEVDALFKQFEDNRHQEEEIAENIFKAFQTVEAF